MTFVVQGRPSFVAAPAGTGTLSIGRDSPGRSVT
jgi:hypothetical protein